MPPKAILTKEEYEPLDAIRKELYVEKDGKYVLDAEGVEDVTGLKNALNATRAEVKKLKADLQATVDMCKDIDPDRARDAQKKLDEMEEKNLLDAGKVDELVRMKTERMRQDIESQIKAFNCSIPKKLAGLLDKNLRLIVVDPVTSIRHINQSVIGNRVDSPVRLRVHSPALQPSKKKGGAGDAVPQFQGVFHVEAIGGKCTHIIVEFPGQRTVRIPV